MTQLQRIYEAIRSDPDSQVTVGADFPPLYTASETARLVLVGQAPGLKAQQSGIPWNDASGDKLRLWLGMSREKFYDSQLVSLLPMDFYYPGKGLHGDLPPRKGFAPLWHPQILAEMPDVRLFILIGSYAQRFYLGTSAKKTLTDTVRSFHEYLPEYFPLVHPSPLNFRWQVKNPWFMSDVIPELQAYVRNLLA
ncbi:MAG TPA: uracil-DNA glycosylase family protein [Verrucomicrobiae bacterium]|nr:uracil-DNA glycosylase family protein [Verrucomicrobiae bacterium]